MRPEIDRSEGDVNLGDRRTAWQAQHLDAATRELLDEDARWFLHQSMSTPCLNALEGAHGAWLLDTAGRRILDFHGNSLHQVGYGHPTVLAAMRETLETLPFSPRRYTNRPAVDLARPWRHGGHRHGAEAGPRGHRPLQNHLHVGRVSRCLA